ncbi:MAG: peptide deformylase [Bacillota bacterium]
MAVLNIRIVGDPVLRSQAKAVESISEETGKLIDNMVDTMYRYNGIGLAAPQVGILQRIIVIDVGDNLIEMVNPRILSGEGQELREEGCLSIPEETGFVERKKRVKVRGLDREGKEINMEAEGLLARAFQHEIDHLNGVLFTDKTVQIEEDEDRLKY